MKSVAVGTIEDLKGFRGTIIDVSDGVIPSLCNSIDLIKNLPILSCRTIDEKGIIDSDVVYVIVYMPEQSTVVWCEVIHFDNVKLVSEVSRYGLNAGVSLITADVSNPEDLFDISWEAL